MTAGAGNPNGPEGNAIPTLPTDPLLAQFFEADGSYATKIMKLSYLDNPSPEWVPTEADLRVLDAACALLRAGHPVAVPTETVYGLAAPLQPKAVARIFEAKRRPADNPLIVHVSAMNMVEPLLPEDTEFLDIYRPLAEEFWPGPLTMVFPARSTVPRNVTAGLSTVAVRFPSHPTCAALIRHLGEPLAAPSANSSGRPSPTLAQHVLDDLNGRIALILDGGPCTGGIESTVVDGFTDPSNPVVLRNGGVTLEMLRSCRGWENVKYYKDLETPVYANGTPMQGAKTNGHTHVESLDPEKHADPGKEAAQTDGYRPRAPGMKYRHYAPRGLCLVARFDPPIAAQGEEADNERVQRLKKAAEREATSRGIDGPLALLGTLSNRSAGAVDPAQLSLPARFSAVYNLGAPDDLASHAAHLFAALRHADGAEAALVLIEGVNKIGEGRGVMERVEKAAEGGEVVA